MFRLVDQRVAFAAQACHAERTPQRDLHACHIKRQCVEVEKPFADKITDFLQTQNIRAEHGDPFGTAAADQFLDRFWAFKVLGLQAQQAHITRAIAHRT